MKIDRIPKPYLYTKFNDEKPKKLEESERLDDRKILQSWEQSSDLRSLVNTEKFQKYKEAQKYVDELGKYRRLGSYDFDKLEGLQYGIKVFEGVSVKQIILLIARLHAICTSRTCSNGCVHCYAEAKPFHVKKDDTQTITKMSWEDFSELTEGIKEFANRLHKPVEGFSFWRSRTISPFVDADSMEIVLKDQNGKEYDMIDISKKIKQDLNSYTLFDTSGWTPKNQKAQQRAQRYVDYIKQQQENGNEDIIVNVSLNPFHKLNSKYVEYIESDPQRAKKFRELYTDRMANVFYTFSPLKKITVLNRALSEYSSANELYKRDAQEQLIKEIRNKLEEKYNADPSCAKESVEDYLDTFDRLTNEILTNAVAATGRLANLLHGEDIALEDAEAIHKKNLAHPETILTNQEGCLGSVFVDANGRVYATDEFNTVATDIQLNFKNKNKKTPPVFGLIEGQVSAEEIFDDLNKKMLL